MPIAGAKADPHAEIEIPGIGTFDKRELLEELKALPKLDQLDVVGKAVYESKLPDAAKKIIYNAIERQRLKLSHLPAADSSTQVKFKATLKSIVLSQGDRSYKMKLDDEQGDIRRKFSLAMSSQRNFTMTFLVPVEKDDGEVTNWETVKFDTFIHKVTISVDGLSFEGSIPDEAVAAMSKLIQNWNDESMEYFLDGFQQALF